jgi:hypothetical protein
MTVGNGVARTTTIIRIAVATTTTTTTIRMGSTI